MPVSVIKPAETQADACWCRVTEDERAIHIETSMLGPATVSRVAGGRCRPPAPSEPDVIVSHHPARAFANASRETRLGPSTRLAIVNLPVTVAVE